MRFGYPLGLRIHGVAAEFEGGGEDRGNGAGKPVAFPDLRQRGGLR